MKATTHETSTTDVELATEQGPVLELAERETTLLAEPTDKKVNIRIPSGKDEEEEGDGEEEEEEEEMWKEEETDDQGSRRAGGGDAKSGNVSRLNVAMNIRRTIAEDLLWTLRTVPRLDELVLTHFIQTFAEEPIDFDLLLPGQQRFVLQRLALDLPLHILDEDYWQRRCSFTWKGPFVISQYDGSWKRMFFENFVQHLVENFVPRLTDPEAFFEEVKVGGQFRLNLVKDGGARAFARALGLNSTLVVLNLACNGITCDAANALGDLLENNSTLKRLDLSGNLLDQECGRRVLQSMERNCSLTDLELRLTQCGSENLYCIGLLLPRIEPENSTARKTAPKRKNRTLNEPVDC